MKFTMKKFAYSIASLLLALFLTGCHSEPASTPIEKRAPGEDITPEARADKRGDLAAPGTGTPPAPTVK